MNDILATIDTKNTKTERQWLMGNAFFVTQRALRAPQSACCARLTQRTTEFLYFAFCILHFLRPQMEHR